MSKPEDRYVKLETKTLPDGRVVYKSCRPRSVASVDTDPTLIAREEDRMDIIANNAYGSATDWWKIAVANGIVNGSLHLRPGMKISIPK